MTQFSLPAPDGSTIDIDVTVTPPQSIRDRIGWNAAPLYDPDDSSETELDLIVDVGGTWVRGDFNWPTVERTDGGFLWHAPDELVARCNRRRLRVLGLVSYRPGWVTDEQFPDRFGDYCGKLAERYGPQGVKRWEIWNEQNGEWGWGAPPNPETYARCLVAAFLAITAVDPDATVIMGGLSPAPNNPGHSYTPPDFLVRTLLAIAANHGGQAFHAIANHCYTTPRDAAADVSHQQLRNVLDWIGAKTVPIWATEVGFTTTDVPAKGVPEADQLGKLVGLIEWWENVARGPKGPLFLYTVRDPSADPASYHSGFGVTRNDRRHKPAYRGLKEYLAAR